MIEHISNRILAEALRSKIGESVTIAGRVLATRDHGKVRFVDVFDRSGKLQVVLASEQEIPPAQSIIQCHGRVVENPNAPNGAEVQAETLTIVSRPTIALPFNPGLLAAPIHTQGPGLETLLDHRTLGFRSPPYFGILRVISEILAGVDEFCRQNGFVEIKTAKIVGGGTEGGANMFEIRYFDRAAYLAQSPQLYKQSIASTLVERVFEIGPAFRSEKHETSRHLNEFTGIDLEISFPTDMHALMDVEEALVQSILRRLQRECTQDLQIAGATLPRLPGAIPRFSLDEVKEIVTGQRPTRSKPAEDMTQEDERLICEYAAEKLGSDLVFVHSFPTRTRPFYTQPLPDNPRKSSSFDLVMRGLEVSSGSIRIHDPLRLEENLRKLGMDPESFAGYLEVFRTGCPPHGGFGMGLERLAARILDVPNVRYTTTFPRDRQRLTP
jgi:nondiscriminating aspartyl-tRNA synthetase